MARALKLTKPDLPGRFAGLTLEGSLRRLACKPRMPINTSASPEAERVAITRRHFLKLSALGATALSVGPLNTRAAAKNPPEPDTAADLEYLTREENFFNVGTR